MIAEGIIAEPVQAEGGDHHGSGYWFRGLQSLCRKHDIQLIIDEVQTGGGATGKMWCHEHFQLEDGADIVTYSKKMLAAGIYHKKDLAPKHPARSALSISLTELSQRFFQLKDLQYLGWRAQQAHLAGGRPGHHCQGESPGPGN